MESSLLNLDSADEETINTIFRAAHSIKGGAGTFGFNEVADFTHIVETLLDELRSGKQPVTPDLVNLLLESVDCIKALLEAAQDGPEADADTIKSVHARLESSLGGGSPAPAENAAEAPVIDSNDSAPLSNGISCWNIKFIPNPDLMQSGHEPAFMFEALGDLGDLTVEPNLERFPATLAELNAEMLYLSWNLTLVSDCSEEDVKEVFEWVEDDCELHIAAGTVEPPKGWKISFAPKSELLQTGNEPIFMFEALSELGELSVEADLSKLPTLPELIADQIHLTWQLTLKSECSEEEVAEVFEWVEDECLLEISPLAGNAIDTVSQPSLSDAPIEQVSEPEGAPQGEPVSAPAAPVQATTPATPSAAPARKAKPAAESTSIRVDTDKIDALINRVGELVITQAMLSQVGEELAETVGVAGSEIERLQSGLEQLERNTRDLQEDVMRVRMLPISFVFNRFPRLVHDVSGKLGKKVELVITGEQTEIDKTVMEKIGDPMVHLIRNSLDHGLETPEERIAAGKPETGRVELNAYHQGGFIVIDIIDDGRGLNTERIRQKALDNGLIAEDNQLTEQEINELIFRPGFSTAEAVSDLSGRGVGMDVVRRNIESLGGHVSVVSEAGYGSTFSVSLPLTLAILDGQLVSVHEQTYIIPLVSIVETIQADASAMSSIAGENKLLHFRDEYIPLINLRALFRLPKLTGQNDDKSLIAIVENSGKKVGIVVDDLYGQQQVVIKSLEVNFKRIEGFAGATILGDGSVALILDIAGLIKRGLDYESAEAARKQNNIFNHEQRSGVVA